MTKSAINGSGNGYFKITKKGGSEAGYSRWDKGGGTKYGGEGEWAQNPSTLPAANLV